MKTMYVNLLPQDKQDIINQRLIDAGLTDVDLWSAMNGRLCDLEDTIDITEFL